QDFEVLANLTSRSVTTGVARPRATPDHDITGLETALYREWATAASDHQCPICIEDYHRSDVVMKIGGCRHWLHK
ncbi:hypothetical protein C8R45DRAFT_793522, partial [Mycena sanguinolenta]